VPAVSNYLWAKIKFGSNNSAGFSYLFSYFLL